jgi:TM2 domain-containing membrane protein YozV
MLYSPRNQRIAAVLAFAGMLPFAFSGLPAAPFVMGHKLYLRQWRWALLYGAIALVPIPWIAKMAWVASVLEGIWYLMQEPEAFDLNFNQDAEPLAQVPQTAHGIPVANSTTRTVLNITDAVRELDQLRQDGLISEYEFEQKRRRLIDRIG